MVLVVGGILTAINQGDHLVRGEVDGGIALRIRLTSLELEDQAFACTSCAPGSPQARRLRDQSVEHVV